ncbi:MAG: hypothetical protein FD121_817 [Gallionellaceae bacterium]|nr:MAG: hypothetical protein FD121_817 [Gallionellaceae bacterium]
MIDSKLLMSAAALCAVLSLNAEAKLFKWVDSNGTTHYGETIPPEYANKDAVKLEKGRIEKREDKNAANQKATLKDPATEKARIEAERHDNALINTYSSEKEIDLSRDRNLQQVEARTGSYTTLLKSAQENLVSLQKEAEGLTKQGRKIPKSLEEDLDEAKVRIAKLQGDLDNSLKENEAVKARYEADKVRYRELKGIVAPKK